MRKLAFSRSQANPGSVVLGVILRWLLILSLPLLLVTIGLAAVVNNVWFYDYAAGKYGVSQALERAGLDLSRAEIHRVYAELIRYYNSPAEPVSVFVDRGGTPAPLFNEREVIHLKDVKSLVRLDYSVLLVTLAFSGGLAVFCLFKKQYLPDLARGLLGGAALTLAIIAAIGLSALVDFDRTLLLFHLLSFSNDFWQLDPARDALIMLIPQGLLFEGAMLAMIITVLLAIALGVTGFCLRSRENR